jgi:hypothetical protein
MPTFTVANAEFDFFEWNCKILENCNIKIEKNVDIETTIGGMEFFFGPRILIDPTFALSVGEIKSKF